jgi:hypothetical protein
MTAPTDTPPRPPTRRGGPPLLAPALAFAVLTVTAILINHAVPHPGSGAATVLAYHRDHATALRIGGLLQFAAAIPLAIWAGTVSQRLRLLGVNAPGPTLGLAGGLLAAAFLGLSGLLAWAGSGAVDGDAALARTLADLTFATGGPGHVVPLALLVAGVAVPVLLVRLVWAPLAWTGLVIAAVGMISTLTLAWLSLAVTLPVARFGAIAWILAISVVLPVRRRRTAAASESETVPTRRPA